MAGTLLASPHAGFFVFDQELDKIISPATENPAHKLGKLGFLIHL
jgi:hypothetical protein